MITFFLYESMFILQEINSWSFKGQLHDSEGEEAGTEPSIDSTSLAISLLDFPGFSTDLK